MSVFQEIDRANIKRAMSHPANLKPIIFCTISLLAIGAVILILGVVIVAIDRIDLGPPSFDAQYERYVGSSVSHIIGPMFIVFGALMTAGNMCMLAAVAKHNYSHQANFEANVEDCYEDYARLGK